MKLFKLIVVFLTICVSLNSQNKVLEFKGQDEEVFIVSPVTGNVDFTMELWFTGQNGASERKPLVAWAPLVGSNSRFHLLSNNNKLVLIDDSYNGGQQYVRPFLFDVVDDNEWHHVVVRKKADIVTVFLDDATPYVYTTSMVKPFNLSENLYLGKTGGNDLRESWDGQIDEFRIWNYARSDDEIAETSGCELVGNEEGLELYYDFENTIQFVFQDLIPDKTFPTNGGVMYDFTEAGNDNLIVNDIGLNNVCGLECHINFDVVRDPCSSSYTFSFGDSDADFEHVWEVSGGNLEGIEEFTKEDLNYSFDWGPIGDVAPYLVCLTATFEDGCVAEQCETFNFFTQQQEDAVYFNIEREPTDVVLEVDTETCNVSHNIQYLRMTLCPDSQIIQVASRSDNKSLDEPYEIGLTRIAIEVGVGFGEILSSSLRTFFYEVDVRDVDGCCDQDIDLSLSFVPNPGFENVNCEPDWLSQLNCAQTWQQATDATSDLFSLEFTAGVSGFGRTPIPPNGSNYWVGGIIDMPRDYVEYVGACLDEPIMPNVDYTFEMLVGTSEDARFGGAYIGDIVMLGIPSCELPIEGTGCMEDQLEVIGRSSVNINAGEWLSQKVRMLVSASQQYDAVMFGGSCNPLPSGQGEKESFYLIYDDIYVAEGTPCNSSETSDCYTIESSEVNCNDDYSYDVSVTIKNENDQVFDRMLTFPQSSGTAISPSLQIDFGGEAMLPPGAVSGPISFQVRKQDFVDEEIEVCFDVIPQNPDGGDCCKDEFCITLPVCCEPEETTSIELIENMETEDCCYDIEITNLCAGNYFNGLIAGFSGEGISLRTEGTSGWATEVTEFFDSDLYGFYYNEGNVPSTVPIYEEPTAIATICVEGVTEENESEQELNIFWVISDGNESGTIADYGANLPTTCEPEPDHCNLIFDPTVTCDNFGNYHLDFTMEISETETSTTRQVVIGPHNGTTVDNYSPHVFEELSLDPGSQSDYTLDLFNVQEGDQFTFSVTLHDFDTPLEDGSFWCCYSGEEITVTIPSCISNDPGGTDPGIQLEPAEDSNNQNPEVSYVIYPNPTRNDFVVAFENETETPIGIELISMQGHKIKQRIIPKGLDRYRLDLSESLPAVYFVKLKKENGSTVGYQKILKL